MRFAREVVVIQHETAVHRGSRLAIDRRTASIYTLRDGRAIRIDNYLEPDEAFGRRDGQGDHRVRHDLRVSKPSCPELLRKGAVARVPEEASSTVLLLLFVDMRFADMHVERWYGQGTIRFPEEPPDGEALVRWGREVVDEDGETLYGELATSFSDVPSDALGSVPTEIIVEWNAANTWDQE